MSSSSVSTVLVAIKEIRKRIRIIMRWISNEDLRMINEEQNYAMSEYGQFSLNKNPLMNRMWGIHRRRGWILLPEYHPLNILEQTRDWDQSSNPTNMEAQGGQNVFIINGLLGIINDRTGTHHWVCIHLPRRSIRRNYSPDRLPNGLSYNAHHSRLTWSESYWIS